jgi:hypothetical protein
MGFVMANSRFARLAAYQRLPVAQDTETVFMPAALLRQAVNFASTSQVSHDRAAGSESRVGDSAAGPLSRRNREPGGHGWP